MRQFTKKMIVSGRFVEIYEYENAVGKGYACTRKGRASKATDDNKRVNRGKVASRARAKVMRTVNANPQLNKFLTLTFAANVQNLDEAHHAFDVFMKRLRRFYATLQYVSVVEFQKRGAVHFHLLCNLPYVDVAEVADMWGCGFVKLNRIDNVNNVGCYVSKYITKDSIDDRLCGRRCYAMSRNLNQPIVITDDVEVEKQLERIDDVEIVYTNTYETEQNGLCTYTCMRLSKLFDVETFEKRYKLSRFIGDIDDINPFIRDKWQNIFKKSKKEI